MKYFNDNEPFVIPWLQSLFPESAIDPRSIKNIDGFELLNKTRVHLFAGIGGWEYALQLAGWPEDRPVWTGSCPCQPFSTAGKRKGTDDARHLWPEMLRLIAECRPPTIFGEQVASKDGRQWLSGVRADLEALGYAVGAADLCAAGIGAPHIRQRLYWVANAQHDGHNRPGTVAAEPDSNGKDGWLHRGSLGGLADTLGTRIRDSGSGEDAAAPGRTESTGPEREWLRSNTGNAGGLEHSPGDGRQQRGPESGERGLEPRCEPVGLGDPNNPGSQGRLLRRDGASEWFARSAGLGPWGTFDLIECTDGKTRRFEPSSFPLAHGVPQRVGRLRAYGNAIVPQVAAEFVRAFMESV